MVEEELLKKLADENIICARCGRVIPLTFKKGEKYTCPSFTFIEGNPVCYRDYSPEDFKS